jgi:hypothetical protein
MIEQDRPVSELPDAPPGRRALLRLILAAGVATLSGCGGDPGMPPPRALNLKRDLSKENGASKRG